jgi:hypothetical protein
LARVSEHYNLKRTQPSLDFVDIDIVGDIRFFVDPRALRLLDTDWGHECVALVQHFFEFVMQAIRKGNSAKAKELLKVLREPNETHLGLSRAEARGRALGHESARDVYESLNSSEAAKTGMLEDLEDTILLVDGISSDIISDITTNLIREPLIHYTQSVCSWYGIPLQRDVDSGPLWDPSANTWHSQFVDLPVTPTGKLLLVPKSIVRRKMEYDADEYYRHYILERLKEVELAANSELVVLLKDGRRRINKKDLEEKYGRGKFVNLQHTKADPTILSRYKADKNRLARPLLSHEVISDEQGSPPPDWQELLDDVLSLPPGRQAASNYERAIESLLTALLYPSLANPTMQQRIHDGRKRIDITYSNVAQVGFFSWLKDHYRAPHVFVECKNYDGDPANPELDQLSGRFSPNRGVFGVLVCRSIVDKPLFGARCRDTANDQRGYIVYLDDEDLTGIIQLKINDPTTDPLAILNDRFRDLVM